MNELLVVGIDPSLTACGVSDEIAEDAIVINTPSGTQIHERCNTIIAQLAEFIARRGAAKQIVLAVEDAMKHAQVGSHLFEAGWLYCRIDAYARSLRAEGIEVILLFVPIATLRKFVTGKGNAPKAQFPAEVLRKWGVFWPSDRGADRAFAYALHKYGVAVTSGEAPHTFAKPRGQGAQEVAGKKKTARGRAVA